MMGDRERSTRTEPVSVCTDADVDVEGLWSCSTAAGTLSTGGLAERVSSFLTLAHQHKINHSVVVVVVVVTV